MKTIDIEQFIVMSHIWFALNKTKIKEEDLLSFLVEAMAIQRSEEHDVDGVARCRRLHNIAQRGFIKH